MTGEPPLRSLRLRPVQLTVRCAAGPLRPQVIAALERHGRPLRWAVTAVDPSGAPSRIAAGPGASPGLRLTVEAVVIEAPPPQAPGGS